MRPKVLNCIYKKESLIDVIVKIWALSRAVLSHDKLDPVAVKKKKKKYRYSLTQSPGHMTEVTSSQLSKSVT